MIRTILILALGGALVYGAFFLEPSKHYFEADAEVAELTERCDDFKEARFDEEWLRIYQEFLVPEHRAICSPEEFIGMYGKQMLRPVELELVDITIDEKARNSKVDWRLTADFIPENMPPQFKKGFQMPDNPEDLRQTQDYSELWAWSEGEWYWLLSNEDVEVLKKSRAGDGKVVLGGGR